MATPVDIGELIECHKLGRYQFWTFALCAAFLFLDGYDAQMVSFAAPALIRDWHISRVTLGPIFSSTTIGFALGAMLFGMVADRFGRRRSTLVCLVSFGAFNLLTATAHSVETLIVYRLCCGLAIGGGMPNGYSLISEYFPRRMRATVIMLAALGYSLGANVLGWSAAFLIPRYDWPSVFWVGGILPLVLFALLVPTLPESMRYLVLRGRPAGEIRRLLLRVAPELDLPEDATFVVAEDPGKGAKLREVFADGRGLFTILLWIATFMNLAVLQFVTSWSPILFTHAGIPLQRALVLSAMFGIGGNVGVGTLGFLIDRWGAHRVLGTGFLVVGIALILMGFANGAFVATALLMAVIGYFVPGGNAGTAAYASKNYPTHVRSTGIGWNLGIGRSGQLLSPIIGTAMVAADWSIPSFFLATSLCAFAAAAAMGLTQWALTRRAANVLAPATAE